jgi:hypothetical protein
MHSTKQDFPFRVSDMDFHMSIFTDYLYFSELLPQLSYQLLTEEWKLGRHLATALISFSGGLVYDLYETVKELASSKSNFNYHVAIGFNAMNILRCLNMEEANEEEKL